MPEANVGDRVSIDAFKVGQPRREGVVEDIDEGLSGARYRIRWDDGHESFFSPKAGNLIVERRARKSSTKNSGKGSRSTGAKGKAKKPAAKKGSGKKKKR